MSKCEDNPCTSVAVLTEKFKGHMDLVSERLATVAAESEENALLIKGCVERLHEGMRVFDAHSATLLQRGEILAKLKRQGEDRDTSFHKHRYGKRGSHRTMERRLAYNMILTAGLLIFTLQAEHGEELKALIIETIKLFRLVS